MKVSPYFLPMQTATHPTDRGMFWDGMDTSEKDWDTGGIENNLDESLSTSETTDLATELKERNVAGARKYQLQDQDELTRIRLGRIMHQLRFLDHLNRIIPARYNNFSKYGQTGFQVLVPTIHGGQWMYVCAVQNGYAPEYSTLKTDDHGLTAGHRYKGWRGEVLLTLITQTYCPTCCTNGKCIHPDKLRTPYISEEDAHREFGEPAPGNDSRLYRKALFSFRNHR